MIQYNNVDNIRSSKHTKIEEGRYRKYFTKQVTILIFCIQYLRGVIKLMINIFFFVQKCEHNLSTTFLKYPSFVLNVSDITYTMISHLKGASIIYQNQQRDKTYASQWKNKKN